MSRKHLVIAIVLVVLAGCWLMRVSPGERGAAPDSGLESESASTSTSTSTSSFDMAAKPAQAARAPERAAPSALVAQAAGHSSSPSQAPTANSRSLASLPAALDLDEARVRIQASSKTPWDFRTDGFSKFIRTLAIGDMPYSGEPREFSDSFVAQYSQALFGVDPSSVHFASVDVSDGTRVTYDQLVDGLPVYGSSLSFFYEHGSLTRVQNDLASGAADGQSQISVGEALERYRTAMADSADVTPLGQLSAQALLVPSGGHLVHAYQLYTQEKSHVAALGSRNFVVLFDAEDPHVIKKILSSVK